MKNPFRYFMFTPTLTLPRGETVSQFLFCHCERLKGACLHVVVPAITEMFHDRRFGTQAWQSPDYQCLGRLLRSLHSLTMTLQHSLGRVRERRVFACQGIGGKWVLLILILHIFLSVSSSSSATLKLVDEVGRQVTLPSSPKRIISLAPNITEILFSLGLDEEIVGVSIHCNFPEKAKKKIQVGSYISLDFERIVFLKPDLVIATGAGNTRDMVDRLEKLGFPTYTIFPKDFDGILHSILHLGKVVDREKEAMALFQEMERRRQKVIDLTQNVPRPKIFLQIGEAPIVTVGKGSFADDLIRLAGGENIGGREKEMYPRLGMEEILKRSPEVILISSMNPKGDYQRLIQEWARWTMIPAVKKGRIHLIDSDLIDRPSPRIIDGLEEIARVLHPERFKKSMQN